MIRKLHHNAYRCRDSEETRGFYEDFLALPLVGTLELGETKTGRSTHTLHTFYRMEDGSHLAFFDTVELEALGRVFFDQQELGQAAASPLDDRGDGHARLPAVPHDRNVSWRGTTGR